MADDDTPKVDRREARKAAAQAAVEQQATANTALAQDQIDQTLENLQQPNAVAALDVGPAFMKHLPYQISGEGQDARVVATHPYGSPSRTFDPQTGRINTADDLNREARKDLAPGEPGAPQSPGVYLGAMTPGAAAAPPSATFDAKPA